MPDLSDRGNDPDLRSARSHPDHWYPLAKSRDLKPGGMRAVSFAGDPIVLVRPEKGALYALEDRCAHRQVPLHEGTVCGEQLKCGYHGWTYDRAGKCVEVPYLGKAHPNGVRAYPCREEYGLIFVFPGDPAKAVPESFPQIPTWANPRYKTRYLDRRVRCHYSFMHENLMDMNHQFLHRSLMGGIQATLLGHTRGEDFVEARYTFTRVKGRQSLGERFMLSGSSGTDVRSEHDVMTIRTQYPYQTLAFRRSHTDEPMLDLWLCYVPTDAAQGSNHSYGLMMIRKPAIPGLIELFWPFIVWFTEGIFAQDRRVVELEQRAHDAQHGDWNQEIFPVIRSLRELLLRKAAK
ncbi:MAG TPA: aromatic ring-hydroxylating dioxygenase subunit alpha, partial [Elusimicrobiota bacterium]|nr:aromatic ring-hydroxylating dioxygenase subunit alpha [Elusimicrobiota bacterium]